MQGHADATHILPRPPAVKRRSHDRSSKPGTDTVKESGPAVALPSLTQAPDSTACAEKAGLALQARHGL